MSRTITITVEVPNDFDDAEQTWEVQQAAQEWVKDNHPDDGDPDDIDVVCPVSARRRSEPK